MNRLRNLFCKKALVEIYLIGGQTIRLKCDTAELKWNPEGKVTSYNFKGHRDVGGQMLAMPPQSIIGIRKIR